MLFEGSRLTECEEERDLDITELKEGDLILVNPGIRFLQIEKYRRRASWETVILLREVPLKNPRQKMATTLFFS